MSTQKPHPVDVAMSEMALSARTPHPEEFESSYQMREAQPGECVNSTDITIRAPGHGQGTEEERVKRIVEILKAECKPRWISGVLWADLARRILAAAASVPVPAVEWTTERMKNLGVCHNGQADAIVDGASGTCALWPSQEMDGLPCMSCSYFEDARLRIEPPVTKGEVSK